MISLIVFTVNYMRTRQHIYRTWSLSTTNGGQILGRHRSCPTHPLYKYVTIFPFQIYVADSLYESMELQILLKLWSNEYIQNGLKSKDFNFFHSSNSERLKFFLLWIFVFYILKTSVTLKEHMLHYKIVRVFNVL